MIENLAKLREPFKPHQISKLPKPYKKDSPKGKCAECGGYHGLPAVHLDYVGHAALTDRLLDVDPMWSWEPLALKDGLPAFDNQGGLWIKLTVCGVTRLGYGNAEPKPYMDVGAREKEVIGDALRNAAMRFGAALDLWHKGDLHDNGSGDEKKDDVKLPSAPINPTTGIEKTLSPERQQYVQKVAGEMMDWINSGSFEDAILHGDNQVTDAEETIYLYTFFDSKQRSAMTKIRAKMKEKSKLAEQA